MIKEISTSRAQMEIWRNPLNYDKFQKPKGVLHIIAERCKECNYCTNYCPLEVLERAPFVNSQGYHPVQVKKSKEDSCVACGMCQAICPDFAIFVTEARP